MNCKKLIFIVFLSVFSLYALADKSPVSSTGFDIICQIYTEAKNSSMTKEQLSDYIFSNVDKRVKSKDALEAHSAVFNLEPAKRYPIFKASAEYSLKQKWGCPAIKVLMQ